MAKKRMFSLGVLDTDAFLDMPLSAQALYFHLNLRADDDGFVGNPKRITQNIGANLDDLRMLVAKRFVLTFEDGVIVIKHWRMHNVIKRDRYTATNFADDMKLLHIKENGAYTFREDIPGAQMEDKWSANGTQMEQMSSTGLGLGIDKDLGLGKGRLEDVCTEQFTAPVPPVPPVYTLPLNDGSEWELTQEQYDEYVSLYPAVDVMCELRKMRGWLNANPERRKTKRGINSFVNRWLSKEQDRAKNPGTATKKPQTRFHNFEERQDDSDEEMALAMMRNRLK